MCVLYVCRRTWHTDHVNCMIVCHPTCNQCCCLGDCVCAHLSSQYCQNRGDLSVQLPVVFVPLNVPAISVDSVQSYLYVWMSVPF